MLIINEGRIVAEDTPSNLAAGLQGVDRLVVEVGGPVAEVLPAIRKVNGVSEVTQRPAGPRETPDGPARELYTIHVTQGQDSRDAISRAIVSSGWSLLSMQSVGMSLEEIFLKLTTQEDI